MEEQAAAVADWYPQRRFGDLPDDMARRFGSREALVFKDERFTFAQLRDEIRRAAKALMALGVEKGDHVSLWLNNRSEWMFFMYALAKIGAVQVPVIPAFAATIWTMCCASPTARCWITHDVSGPIDYLAHRA